MLVYWLDRGDGQVLCLSSQGEECICQGILLMTEEVIRYYI